MNVVDFPCTILSGALTVSTEEERIAAEVASAIRPVEHLLRAVAG
jgi:hypothetical protein